MKRLMIFLFLLLALSGCTQKSEEGIRTEIYTAGTTYLKSMQKSVEELDKSPSKGVVSNSDHFKEVCTKKFDYSKLSKKETKFIDSIGDLRIAYEHVVDSRNSKYKDSFNEEAALGEFNSLSQKFVNNYKVDK
ncbi:membrane lipoprotein lipid attachment site-containing protein [Bacillus sp. NTK034]|uniref:membrane lipoprotein lipid attachment site-containing protein n=1 Tax=Bacillus sp. NTK034 TaxID=2802176 RepID=UPI001A8E41E0|nr:membrane lipoprotein lipid attachment site-containing protein [Bacillus sp. NTK034]MBN8201442.1 membrane lipoprotein lipid attachment site-containing protein [Bacillus sp. NTK034]